jgi:uncharacterized RDD family membrane protein YckC
MAPFASWGSRVVAAIVDAFVIMVPAVVLSSALFGGVAGLGGDDDAGFLAAILGILLFFVLLAVVSILYAPLLMRRPGERNGQTWGKQLMGIRVVRENGVPMDFTWSAVREPLVKGIGLGFASTIIPVIPYLLDALWPLWDDENRAIHDMVVGTRVVQA